MELKNYFAQTSTGVVISGATFYVYNSGTTVLATIYDKDGVALANPSTATSHGLIQFRATDGDYEVTVLSGSSSYSIPCKCFDGTSAFRECLRRSYSGGFGDLSFLTLLGIGFSISILVLLLFILSVTETESDTEWYR